MIWRREGQRYLGVVAPVTVIRKSVYREVAMLTATGLIELSAADEVAVGWDQAVTELDLAA